MSKETLIPEDAATSSEKASRYLRKKTTDIEPLIKFANSLIDGSYPSLFFPRKEEFLLEWWFDRAEAGMKNERFWQLFPKLWDQTDKDSRIQIFHRHKYLDTLKSVLQWISGSEEPEKDKLDYSRIKLAIRPVVLDSLERVSKDQIYMRTTNQIMVSIVVSYLKLTRSFKETASDAIARSVFSVYDNALYGVLNYKKVSQALSSDGLVAVFIAFEKAKRESYLYTRLGEIIRDLVYSPSIMKQAAEGASGKKEGKKNTVNSGDTVDREDLFKNLFDVLKGIPDIQQKGELLSEILGLGLSKFEKTKQKALMPKLCEAFLQFSPASAVYLISQAQSQDMIMSSAVLTKALEAQAYKDWPLATTIVDLDPDAVLPITDKLVHDNLTLAPSTTETVEFLCHLASAYARIRDLQAFMTLWKEELASTGNFEESSWKSEILVRNIAGILSENWTVHQFSSAIPNHEIEHAELLPLISIVLACSRAADSLNDAIKKKLVTLHEKLLSDDSKENYLAWRLRYLIISVNREVAKSVVASTDLNHLLNALISPEKKLKDRRVIYFMIQNILRISEFQLLENFSQVADYILTLLSHSKAKYESWDKESRSIGKQNVSTAMLHSIVERWLVLAENRFTPSQIQLLAEALWHCGKSDKNSELWSRLLDGPLLYEQVQLKNSLADLLVSQLAIDKSEDRDAIIKALRKSKSKSLDEADLISKAIDALLQYPIESLRRSIRARVLDCLLLIDKYSSDLQLMLKSRTLIQKFLALPNMKSILQTNPVGLSSLISKSEKLSDFDLDNITTDIMIAVFGYAVGGDSTDSSVQFLKDVHASAFDILQSGGSVGRGTLRMFSLSSRYIEKSGSTILDENILKGVELISDMLSQPKQKLDILTQRSALHALSELSELLSSRREVSVYGAVLNLIPEHVKILSTNTESDANVTPKINLSGQILQTIFGMVSSWNHVSSYGELRDAQRLTTLYTSLNRISQSTLSIDSSIIRQKFKEKAKGWSKETFETIFDQLLQISTHTENSADAESINTLTALLTVEGSDHNAFLTRRLSLMACTLVLDQQKITSARSYLDTLKLFETVMKEKTSLITPFTFTQLFTFLILTSSQSGPKFSDSYSVDEVYIRICSTASSIILLLGRYFRGRHNLVIRLLENLLYGLCRLRKVAVQKLGAMNWKRASWLPVSQSCSVDCALAYSRLLANICDPNLSRSKASSNPKKRSRGENQAENDFALSSSSGTSRRALSKHVPFLITEYCYAATHYSFDADVQQALITGLYTVFDIMGEHELAITNASVDTTGRAIFKRLYEDYNKFGKWHEI